MDEQTTIPYIERWSHQTNRGEFVDSEFRKSHIILRKGGSKIEVDERNGFMTLRGSVERNNPNG